MKLPEAIALMLEGKVMVDADGDFNRAKVVAKAVVKFLWRGDDSVWREVGPWHAVNGWREATPEELKEIGL